MTSGPHDEFQPWVPARDTSRPDAPPARVAPRPDRAAGAPEGERGLMLPPAAPASEMPPRVPRAEPPPALRPTVTPEPPRPSIAPVVGRVAQVVDLAFFVLYAMLGLRLALTAINARPGADFVRFVHAVTQPFFAPFEGIVSSPTLGPVRLDMPVVVALVAYALLHAAIDRLLRIGVQRKVYA